MRIEVWISIGLIGVAYLIWKWRSMKGDEEEMEYEEEVTDFKITSRQTIERDGIGDTDADTFERDGGIYKMKTFSLNNGEKIAVHSEENPVPHGLTSDEEKVSVETKQGKKKQKPLIDALASRNFVTGALDNLTTISGGGGWNIGKYLRMIPGELYFLLMVLLVMFL